jgi:DNA-binding NarL/FixJ family response regulator
MGMPIKVLLADAGDMMRAPMRQILTEEPSIEIVGEAPSFTAAIQMVADIKPEVLLLDLHLPEKCNFVPDFVRSQLRSVPNPLALALSNDTEDEFQMASNGFPCQLSRRL